MEFRPIPWVTTPYLLSAEVLVMRYGIPKTLSRNTNGCGAGRVECRAIQCSLFLHCYHR
jgi:hypothetical protein